MFSIHATSGSDTYARACAAQTEGPPLIRLISSSSPRSILGESYKLMHHISSTCHFTSDTYARARHYVSSTCHSTSDTYARARYYVSLCGETRMQKHTTTSPVRATPWSGRYTRVHHNVSSICHCTKWHVCKSMTSHLQYVPLHGWHVCKNTPLHLQYVSLHKVTRMQENGTQNPGWKILWLILQKACKTQGLPLVSSIGLRTMPPVHVTPWVTCMQEYCPCARLTCNKRQNVPFVFNALSNG